MCREHCSKTDRMSCPALSCDEYSTLRQLHLLPVHFCISYKLCLLMLQIHTPRAPSYLSDIVTQTRQTAGISSRSRLQSSSSIDQLNTIKICPTSIFVCCTSCLEQSAALMLQQISNTNREFSLHT